jgi:nucleoside-diphosphate-sugar epimerase
LVTGAAGFIGANILHELSQRQGVTPIGWARPEGNRTRLAHLKSIATEGVDITSPSDVARALGQHRPDIIINAATYGVAPDQRDPARTYAVNVKGTQTLLRAAHRNGVKRFLQLGTFFEYGDRAVTLSEDVDPAPKGSYAATKTVASIFAAYGDHGVNDVAALRLFNVWGRWESPHRLVPQVIAACRSRVPLALTSGTQTKDMVYAGDMAAWIADLALCPTALPHRVINLASGNPVTVHDFVDSIATTLGGRDLMQFGAMPVPATEPQAGPADTKRLDALLPHRRRTSLADALADMMRA